MHIFLLSAGTKMVWHSLVCARSAAAGEMSESGLRSTIGNRVYAKSVSGVRIPISPPVIFRKRLFWALSFSPAPLVADTYFGRVAERLNAAVSKTVLPVLPVTRVQIPPLPPAYKGLPLAGLFYTCSQSSYEQEKRFEDSLGRQEHRQGIGP